MLAPPQLITMLDSALEIHITIARERIFPILPKIAARENVKRHFRSSEFNCKKVGIGAQPRRNENVSNNLYGWSLKKLYRKRIAVAVEQLYNIYLSTCLVQTQISNVLCVARMLAAVFCDVLAFNNISVLSECLCSYTCVHKTWKNNEWINAVCFSRWHFMWKISVCSSWFPCIWCALCAFHSIWFRGKSVCRFFVSAFVFLYLS